MSFFSGLKNAGSALFGGGGFGSIKYDPGDPTTVQEGQGNDALKDTLTNEGREDLIDTTTPFTEYGGGSFFGTNSPGGPTRETENFGMVDLGYLHQLEGTGNPALSPILKGGNAYDTAWSVHNYQESLRKDMYTPLMEDTAGQVGKSNMVGSAVWDTAIQANVSKGMSDRNKSRYGQNYGPAQQQYMDDARQRGVSLDMVNNVNNARIDEYEYDNSLRRGMTNIGRQQMNDAAAGAGVAAGSQSQRESAGDQAAAAHQAQQQQNAAAAASAILTIAVLAK